MSTADAILTLRVVFPTSNSTRAMRFGSDNSVGAVLKDIAAKGFGEGADHGLYVPPNKELGSKGVWLVKNRSLRYYGLGNNSTVEYKKRHRVLRVRLADSAQRSVVVDASATVRDIADSVAARLGITKGAELFGLRRSQAQGNEDAPSLPFLNENRTLDDEEVREDEELEFAQRYHAANDTLEKDDGLLLHLMYADSQRSVVAGKHVGLTRNDARDLAALQVHITYGDHEPSKHGPSFVLDPQRFLPPAQRKDKAIAGEVMQAHKKLVGMKEHNAKYRYVQLVRSLKTYGIDFFECQVKMRAKRAMIGKGGGAKLQRVLLGVSRSRLVEVEADSMAPMKEWTLEQLRRWSAAHGTLTLDFGDYDEDYLVLITDQADAISQLIAGYIDLILKTRVDTDTVVEDDEHEIGEAEQMTGQFGLAMTGFTASYSNPYANGAGQHALNDPGAQYSRHYPGMNPMALAAPPRSQLVTVIDATSAVKVARLLGAELGAATARFGPPSSLSDSEWHAQFKAHKTKIAEGTKDLLAQARLGPSALTRAAMDSKAKELAHELKGMATAARQLTLLSDDNASLVDGSKATAEAVADLLELLVRAADAPSSPTSLPSSLLDAVERQVVAAQLLSADPRLVDFADKGAELLVLECAASIDLALDDLLARAASVAPSLPPPRRDELLAPTESARLTKAHVLHSLEALATRRGPQVSHAVQGAKASLLALSAELVSKVKALIPGPQVQSAHLTESYDRVALALTHLEHASSVSQQRGAEGVLDLSSPVQDLLASLASIRSDVATPSSLIEGVKGVAFAQNRFVLGIKALAQGCDANTQQRLMDATSALSTQVKELMGEARALVKEPSDLTRQAKVVAVVGALEGHAQRLLSDAGSLASLSNLRFTAKTAAGALVKLSTHSTLIAADVSDPSVRAELLSASAKVSGALASLLSALKGTAEADLAHSASAHDSLLVAAREALPKYSELTASATKAARSLADANAKQELSFAAHATGDSLAALMKSVMEVNDSSAHSALEDALSEFDSVRADLNSAEFAAHQGQLVPLPGQTRENALALLSLAASTLTSASDSLVSAAKSSSPLPVPVRQSALGMAQVASAARSLASTLPERSSQRALVAEAKSLNESVLNLVALTRSLHLDSTDPVKLTAVTRARQALSVTLGSLRQMAEGVDSKDVTKAIEDIHVAKGALRKDAPTRVTFKDASESLAHSAKALTSAIAQLTSPSSSSSNLVKITGATTAQLLSLVSSVASAAPSVALADSLLASARALADAMATLLTSASASSSPMALTSASASASALSALDTLVSAVDQSSDSERSAQRILALVTALDNGSLTLNHFRNPKDDPKDEVASVLAATSEFARVSSALVASARLSPNPKASELAKESVGLVQSVLTSAASASLADPSTSPTNEPSGTALLGQRMLKGLEVLLERPQDPKHALVCAKKLTQLGAQLIGLAKERAKSEPEREVRAEIVRASQSLIEDTNLLARATQEAANPTSSTSSDPKVVTSAALALRESIEALTLSTATTLSSSTSIKASSAGSPLKGAAEASLALAPASDVSVSAHSELITHARSLSVAMATLIRATSAVGTRQDDALASDTLKRCARDTTRALQELTQVAQNLTPALLECTGAITSIEKDSTHLHTLALSTSASSLATTSTTPTALAQYQASAVSLCESVAEALQFGVAASGSSRLLAEAAPRLAAATHALTQAISLLAGTTKEHATQTAVLEAAKDVADYCIDTLRALRATPLTADSSNPIAPPLVSEATHVAQDKARTALALLLSQLQSSAQLSADLDALAERALLECAKVIANASHSLAQTQAQAQAQTQPMEGEGSLDLQGVQASILSAATTMARACGSLVASAASAQKERVAEKKRATPSTLYAPDAVWARGLVSAAQSVSGAVQSLVTSANDLALTPPGSDSPKEPTVAAARSVAAATAHLVAAARVKADPNAPTQRALSAAAKTVTEATTQIVVAASKDLLPSSSIPEPEPVPQLLPMPKVGAEEASAAEAKRVMDQRIKILQLERELELARAGMKDLNRGKYANGGKQ